MQTRSLLSRLGVVATVITFLVSNSFLVFKASANQQDIGVEKGIKVENLQTLKADTLAPRFKQLLSADKAIAALSQELLKQGFSPQTGAEDFIGWNADFRGPDGRTANSDMIFQNYFRDKDKTQATLGKITISSGNNALSYNFFLIATGDDFSKSIEYTVDSSANVVRAHSWWTCVLSRVSANCGSGCLDAFSQCRGPWYSYIGCVVTRCACVLGAMICCGCNCTGWCSWFSGCCRQ